MLNKCRVWQYAPIWAFMLLLMQNFMLILEELRSRRLIVTGLYGADVVGLIEMFSRAVFNDTG
ncbi:MAG TPA: hypothetical protein DCX08_13855 [Porticoccaceae bacterium]|jgi:hypothetical protein|nr:hypothetical protein [Porticoccaceae bacterium]